MCINVSADLCLFSVGMFVQGMCSYHVSLVMRGQTLKQRSKQGQYNNSSLLVVVRAQLIYPYHLIKPSVFAFLLNKLCLFLFCKCSGRIRSRATEGTAVQLYRLLRFFVEYESRPTLVPTSFDMDGPEQSAKEVFQIKFQLPDENNPKTLEEGDGTRIENVKNSAAHETSQDQALLLPEKHESKHKENNHNINNQTKPTPPDNATPPPQQSNSDSSPNSNNNDINATIKPISLQSTAVIVGSSNSVNEVSNDPTHQEGQETQSITPLLTSQTETDAVALTVETTAS